MGWDRRKWKGCTHLQREQENQNNNIAGFRGLKYQSLKENNISSVTVRKSVAKEMASSSLFPDSELLSQGLKVAFVALGGGAQRRSPKWQRRLLGENPTSPKKKLFRRSSSGNKASSAARWLLLRVTLFMPSCAVTHSEGHLLQPLALQAIFPQLNTLLI